ncbi:hypothetical protein CERZMDRAFT_48552 [Cercospora zeae-maydis SCOH1-5]|uniref:EKC/KEOPS complex subunit BUD32 n=1 Tax=Cercospora zeae-maydis SCOH1-5 TaxID=717836 RepID=A0A6A6F309_9PEZI|nr:hypothetical protein CERZMDRAFT_48552 [Cercospora zeae-maydis SCOH1-5]
MAFKEYTISLPFGLGLQDLVGAGITGTVRGLVLGYAHHGTVRQYLQSHPEKPPLSLRLRWIEQMVKAVTVLHSSGVLHGDLSCNNFFLDENLDIKCGDFAGSSIDGEEALTCYETRSAHPKLPEISCESDIFALGSCIYEAIAGTKPFAHLADREIEEAYLREEFPDLTSLDTCNEVIAKCWGRRYDKVSEIAEDVRQEARRALACTNFFRYSPHFAVSRWAIIPIASPAAGGEFIDDFTAVYRTIAASYST